MKKQFYFVVEGKNETSKIWLPLEHKEGITPVCVIRQILCYLVAEEKSAVHEYDYLYSKLGAACRNLGRISELQYVDEKGNDTSYIVFGEFVNGAFVSGNSAKAIFPQMKKFVEAYNNLNSDKRRAFIRDNAKVIVTKRCKFTARVDREYQTMLAADNAYSAQQRTAQQTAHSAQQTAHSTQQTANAKGSIKRTKKTNAKVSVA